MRLIPRRYSLRTLFVGMFLLSLPVAYSAHCYYRCSLLLAIQQEAMGDMEGDIQMRYPLGQIQESGNLSQFYSTTGIAWLIATPRIVNLQIVEYPKGLWQMRCRDWGTSYVFIALRHEPISPEGLEHLLEMSQVRDITLQDLALSRAAVDVLMSLTKLEEITLNNVSIAMEDKVRLRNSRVWEYWACDGEPTIISQPGKPPLTLN